MIIEVLASTFIDINNILKEDNYYFSKSIQDKRKIFKYKYPNYPTSFTSYYTNIDSDVFISDYNKLLQSDNNDFNNKMIKSAISFLTYEFSMILDSYDTNDNEIQGKLDIPKSALKDYVFNFINNKKTYTEIINQIRKDITLYCNPKIIVVQSAMKLHPKIRKDIRNSFRTEDEFVLIDYQYKPELIGGIKVMVNACLYDNSWSTTISNINLHKNYER